MKIRVLCALLLLNLTASLLAKKADNLPFFTADNANFQYVGRVDFANPLLPRFWAPGVYIEANFQGSSCEVVVNDEQLWGKQNYLTVVIDNGTPKRLKLSGKENRILVADGLSGQSHKLLICKATESGIGYLEFVGISVEKLLKPDALPERRIEFIGNSITCGTGSDLSEVPCGKGDWHDQHNAYLSYGSITARALNASWTLTSVSGIGLIHSCCNLDRLMPDVIDKINLNNNTIPWDFGRYQPDVVTVTLGQNDGIQDSAAFCKAYVQFVNRLRGYYPRATIICLTSPMADAALTAFMKSALTSVVASVNESGDKNVYSFFYSKQYASGCDYHPSLSEHAQIANELTAFIKIVKCW